MGWLIAAGVIFGIIFLAILTIGVSMLLSEADYLGDFLIGLVFVVGGAGLGATLVAAFPLTWAQTHYNERAVDCYVKGKDRGGKENDMRIYTSCGVFQNTDSILRGKNTSADVWSHIEVGKTQTFHVVGWRFGLTSDFPNVLEVQ